MFLQPAARVIVTTLVVLQSFAPTVPAESRSLAHVALVEKLLDLEPSPVDLGVEAEAERARRKSLNSRMPPADDAPIEALVSYWSLQRNPDSAPLPSARTREQLLDAVDQCEPRAFVFGEREPLVDVLAWYLPLTERAFDRVFELTSSTGAGAESEAGCWLRRNSRYYRDELVRAAAVDRTRDWYDHERDLRALCTLDWETARPIVLRLGASSNPKSQSLALALTFEHAQDPALRGLLAALAVDQSASAYERDAAIGALASIDWPGRDAWLVSLFSDASLGHLVDGNLLYSPLLSVLEGDPDRFVPLIAKLVSGSDRTAHDNAVACLVEIGHEQFRADAIRPLLPWLDDPDWSSAPGFGALVVALMSMPIPESVPGLMRVVERDDGFDRAYAAEALGATYHEANALPLLERALEREDDPDFEESIVRGIAESGALTDARIVEAVEAFADLTSAADGVEALEADLDDPDEPTGVPDAARLGEYLAHDLGGREGVAESLLRRVARLRREHSPAATRLAEIVHRSTARAALDDLAARLLAGDLDVELVVSGLGRRRELREEFGAELSRLATGTGAEAGLAALILGDKVALRVVLAGRDELSVMFGLAGARLTRTTLPIAAVAAVMDGPNPGVVRAAEAYLLDEDSAGARKQLLARSAGIASIVGNRLEPFFGNSRAAAFDDWESRLRAEVIGEGGPDEIFALLETVIVRIRDGKAEAEIFTMFPEPASRRRLLSSEEVLALRRFVAERGVDDLPPIAHMSTSCFAPPGQSEYLHLTKNGGVRVFMSLNWMDGGESCVYDEIEAHFARLAAR